MRWTRTLQTVDVHCAGEIGRVITGGVLNVPGSTMAEKLLQLNTVDDSLQGCGSGSRAQARNW